MTEKEVDPFPRDLQRYPQVWIIIDHTFTWLFLAELLVNMYANFLCAFWSSGCAAAPHARVPISKRREASAPRRAPALTLFASFFSPVGKPATARLTALNLPRGGHLRRKLDLGDLRGLAQALDLQKELSSN